MRVCLIGYGYWGKNLARVFGKDLVGICDYEEDNLEKAKNQGYFPVGLVMDGHNLEILFKRHPKQEEKHRFVELNGANDNMKM